MRQWRTWTGTGCTWTNYICPTKTTSSITEPRDIQDAIRGVPETTLIKGMLTFWQIIRS